MTKIWNSTVSGNWATAADWTPSGSPIGTDDAAISSAGAYTVSITANQAVNSLLMNAAGATLSVGGVLSVGTTTTLAGGTLALQSNGTLKGGKLLTTGGTLISNTGTFDGVTVQGSLDLSAAFANLTAINGLTLNAADGSSPGAINITGQNARLYVAGNTVLNHATIAIGASNTSTGYLISSDPGAAGSTLTLGPALTINHAAGDAVIQDSYGTLDGVTNQGTINAQVTGGLLTFGGNQLTNAATGRIASGNGDQVLIQTANFTNSGTLAVATGGTLGVNATNWSGAGAISEVGGTLILGGTFPTAALAGVTRTGGTIALQGTLDNTGATLNIGGATALGVLTLNQGNTVIKNGTVADMGSGLLPNGGTLLNVTYQGPLVLSNQNANLALQTALSLTGAGGVGPGTMTISGSNVHVGGIGSLTLDNFTILESGTGSAFLSDFDQFGGGGVLTLGSKLTLTHSSGTVLLLDSDNPVDGIVNQGTINATAASGNITTSGYSFTNGATGQVIVANGDAFIADSGHLNNQGTMTVSTGGQLTLGRTWTNTGTISENGGTISLGGTFATAGLTGISRTGGVVSITGTLNNAAATFNVGTGSTLGAVVLGYQALISGGTVHDAGSGLSFSNGVLDGVAYRGTLDLSNTGASVTLLNATTLSGLGGSGPGAVNLTGANAHLSIENSSTLDNATISIGNAGLSFLSGYDPGNIGTTLTYGHNLTINHVAGSALLNDWGSVGDNIVNQGSIAVGASGGTFTVQTRGFTNAAGGILAVSNGDNANLSVTTFANAGTLQVTTGSTLTIGGTWSSTGSIVENASTLNLGGNFASPSLGGFSRTGGKVSITGTLDNTGNTLNVGTGSALGAFSLPAGGTIKNGIVHDAGSGIAGSGGTLDGVAYQGVLDLSATSASLTLANAFSLTGAGGTGTGAITATGLNAHLNVASTATLDNIALAIGNGGVLASYDPGYTGIALTLGTNFTVTHTSLAATLQDYGGASDSLTNLGAINAGIAGSFTISGHSFINGATGAIAASGGDSMTLSASNVSNAGLFKVGGAGSTFNINYAFANYAAQTLTGGTYEVDAGGTMVLPGGDTVATLNADVILNGAASALQSYGFGGNANFELSLASIGAAGQLHILGGRNFAATGTLNDLGKLELGGGQLSGPGLSVGGTLFGFGTVNEAVADNGLIEAKGGLLKLASTVSGSGALQIDGGATLEIGALGANAVTFAGAAADLLLDTPATFAGVLTNLGAGDIIDLSKLAASSASVAGNVLTVNLTAGGTKTYALASPQPIAAVTTASDGASGTDLLFYGLAQPSQATPQPVNFGNHHAGDVLQQTLSIGNLEWASPQAELLDAAFGTLTGGVTASGTINHLAAGTTNTSSLVVGIGSATTGAKSGTAVVLLNSDGSGVDSHGITPLTPQTISIAATIYQLAAPSLTAASLNLGTIRIGGAAATQSAVLHNGSAASAFQEGLSYSFAAPAGIAGKTASPGTVASGGSLSLGFALDNTVAGSYSNLAVPVTLASSGAIDGLANTPLASGTIALTGKVYAPAVAALSSGSVAFSVVHVGDVASKSVTLTNQAAGALTDSLVGSVGAATAPFQASGAINLAQGASLQIPVSLSTSASGVFTGTEAWTLASHDSDLADQSLTVAPVTLSGTVDNYAVESVQIVTATGTQGGSGASLTLDFGTLHFGVAANATLDVLNTASGLADLLGGSFTLSGSPAFGNTGFVSFAGLGAGQGDTAPVIALDTSAAGTFSETIVVHAAASNASGYNQAFADTTITVTGVVTATPWILTTGTDHIAAGSGADTIVAPSGATVSAGDSIDGGGGVNTLALTGTGTYDLGLPALLSNLQTVAAQEGQTAFGAFPDTTQTVKLRAGTAMTVNVLANPAPNASNPGGEVITILGAANTDIVNFGSGIDTFTVGGTSETVHGGSGTAIINVTAATIGATIDGGSGASLLNVSGGGAMAMGANITNLKNVLLLGGTQPNYVFTANAIAGLTVAGSTGDDTIIVGAPSQTILGGGGHDLIKATAANAAAVVQGQAGAPATFEITTGGSVTLAAATNNVAVSLDFGITLTLNAQPNVSVAAATTGNTIFLGNPAQSINAGPGGQIINATPANAGAAIAGGALFSTLNITGAGSSTLNAATTNLKVEMLTAGTLALNAQPSISVVALSAGNTFTLGNPGQSINGGPGGQVIFSTAANAGAAITGGTSGSTLNITTGGISTINAASNGLSIVMQAAGTLVLNATATTVSGSAGADTVMVGGASQTIKTNGGNDLIKLPAADASTAVDGGTGVNTLEFTTGGTIALPAADANVQVQLDAASTLKLNAATTITAVTGSTGNDTITLGALGQTVAAGGGNDRVITSAAFAGTKLDGGTGVNVLEITGGGTATLNNADVNFGTVQLDAATHLNLGGMTFAHAIGSTGADTITAGGGAQTLTGGLGADTLVGAVGFGVNFIDVAAGLNSDIIKNFAGTDLADVTDLKFASLTKTFATVTGGVKWTLADTQGHTAAITFAGSFTQANFTFAADSLGGTQIGFH